jgi:hypothetical protein
MLDRLVSAGTHLAAELKVGGTGTAVLTFLVGALHALIPITARRCWAPISWGSRKRPWERV